MFSADPRIVPDARKLRVVSFEEMLEMAASGAKVLQLRSVEYARNHEVPIHCRSSFEDGAGTLVVSEKETMERPLVTAVTHADESRVTLTGVRDEPGVAGRIFGALAERERERRHDHPERARVRRPEGRPLVHASTRDDLRAATEAIEGLEVGERLETDERIGKVSIVGAGMRSHPGVAAKVFQTLGEHGINIEMISTSPIKISCVIAAERGARRRSRRCTRRSSSATTPSAARSRPGPSTGRRRPSAASDDERGRDGA